MPRQPSLTISQIATAALAVIDRDGLGGLSMRTLADELNFGTMSLYRYVSDRGHLEAAIVDHVLETVDPSMPRGSVPRKLTVLAQRLRASALQHPAAMPLLLIHRHRSVNSLRWGETVLRVLAQGGIDGRDRVIAFRALSAYIFGALQVEHYSPLSGMGTDALAELPPALYPELTETAAAAKGVDPEAEFRGGLALLLGAWL
jgi:AcrR family transcriptional regulator